VSDHNFEYGLTGLGHLGVADDLFYEPLFCLGARLLLFKTGSVAMNAQLRFCTFGATAKANTSTCILALMTFSRAEFVNIETSSRASNATSDVWRAPTC